MATLAYHCTGGFNSNWSPMKEEVVVKPFLGSVPASIRDFVGPWVGPRKTLIVLIGFQTANKIHLASREVQLE